VVRLPAVGFGKLVLGVIIAGLGVVLLAGNLGYIPAGTGGWFFHYWPILLIGFGLALLANSVKSALLGWVATLVIIGGLGFAAWWAYHHGASSPESYSQSIDLRRPRTETVTLRARVFGGALAVASKASAPNVRTLDLIARGVGGDDKARPRFVSSAGAGILDWPATGSHVYEAPLGADLKVLAPQRLRVRLEAKSLVSEVRADLSDLRPERCEVEAIASTVRIVATGPVRPTVVRLRGTLSNYEVQIPASCPVRLEFSAPFAFRSLPEDFVQQRRDKKSPVRVWTADGTGPVIRILVEGPLVHVRVRREPLRAI
jgi:hypothetical protein